MPTEDVYERVVLLERLAILERLAVLEAQSRLSIETAADYRSFKESMIAQIATLRADLNTINWKVGSIIGGVVVVGNFLINLGLGKLVH
jgi:hypothetical protein